MITVVYEVTLFVAHSFKPYIDYLLTKSLTS